MSKADEPIEGTVTTELVCCRIEDTGQIVTFNFLDTDVADEFERHAKIMSNVEVIHRGVERTWEFESAKAHLETLAAHWGD